MDAEIALRCKSRPAWRSGRWFGLLLLLSGCELSAALVEPDDTPTPLWKLSGPTMGTRYAVSVVGGDDAQANALRDRIDSRLAVVNRRMSTYDPESELSRFNALDSDEWFSVSGETAATVAYALEIARASKGAFDPTVGPAVNLWGFGPDKRRVEPPTEAEIKSAVESVGHGLVAARNEPPAVRKMRSDVYLDLSAVAKGRGVDAIAELLIDSGVDAFLVEIGGEVRARGVKPDGSAWRVGVERADAPLLGRPRLQRVVELSDQSLATSGDYRNFFEHDGRRYSHTIDPRTGRPVEHDLATVTVLADSCMVADTLATALLVLGPDAGYDWAVERGIAALFVTRTEDREFQERSTPDWPAPAEETTE